MSTIVNLILTLGVGGFLSYYCYKLGYSEGKYETLNNMAKEKCDNILERIEEMKYTLGKEQIQREFNERLEECLENNEEFRREFKEALKKDLENGLGNEHFIIREKQLN